MKKKLLIASSIAILIILGLVIKTNLKSSTKMDILRKQHATFLENSPFKDTKNLSKSERKAQGLPPNSYSERRWELSMDPTTGKPETQRLFELQESLRNQFNRVPGENTNDWVERGPNNVGGRTRALMYDPNDATKKRVFAGGVSGGLWVIDDITNSASIWSEVNIPQNLAVSKITYDPNNTNIFYLGTGESYVAGDVNGNGLWKSTDGGVSWNQIFGGITGETSFRVNSKITVNSPIGIAGDYGSMQAGFGGSLLPPVTANLVLADDGTAIPSEACSSLTNSGAINGNIAIIRRGTCSFTTKVKNAQNAGAIAVVVVNSASGPPFQMTGSDATITIPAVMVSKTDGEAIISQLGSGVNITIATASENFVGNFVTPGIQHINDVIVRNNVGVSEIFVAAGAAYYRGASPLSYLGIDDYGIYMSNDGGATWNKLSLPTDGNGNNFMPNDLEIGADNKVWLSTTRSVVSNGGGGNILATSTTNSTFTIKKTMANARRTEIAVSSQNANVIYAMAESTNTNRVEIIKTTDGFATDSNVPIPEDVDQGIPATDFTRGQAFYDLVLEVNPDADSFIYAGGIDLFSSGDSGTNWQQISKWSNNNDLAALNVSLVHADQHALVFNPNDSFQAILGNDGGVYYVSDFFSAGTSTSAISARNNNYNTLQFYKGAIGQEVSAEKFLAGAQDNGSQLINNASAGINGSNRVTGGDGAYVFIDKDNEYMISSYVYNTFYYLNYASGGVLYQIDNNQSSGDFINPAALDSGNNILYSNGTSGGTFQINRYVLGTTSAVATTFTDAMMDGAPTAFKVSPFTNTTLLVGTDNGKLFNIDEADNLTDWTEITGPDFYGSVSCIEFGATANDILVTFLNYGVTSVFYSNDKGVTWTNKEGDLPDLPVGAIMMNPLNADEVIIGTDLGVWATPNFSATNPNWYQTQNGMKDAKVTSFDLRTADNTVLASTYGRGVFTGQFTADPTSLSIDDFAQNSLIKIYPTVSSGQITIAPTSDALEGALNIFDINGREVHASKLDFSTGVNQQLSLNLSSGVYIVKFTANDVQSTQKIVIQ